jgi:hypothetical protein
MSTRAKLIVIGAVLVMLLAMAAEAAFANDGDTFIYLPALVRQRPEPTICNLPCPRPSYVPPTVYPTRTPRPTPSIGVPYVPPTATATVTPPIPTPFINEPPKP